MNLNTRFAQVMVAVALFTGCHAVEAQDKFPSKPIRLLIPFPPGTGNDVVGRIVGNKLPEFIGERVVADNRPGASGNLAVEMAKNADPDGYTIVMASTSFSINQHTMKNNFKPDDFSPVALIGELPYTLVVAKSVPAKNMKDLAALIKSQKGKFNAGSGGPTGTSFFLLDSYRRALGTDITLVPYKGTTAAVVDLMAERLQILFAPLVTSLPHYKAGKVQVQGISGSSRSSLVPEVPTFNESGYPMLDIPTFFALVGPAGIPDAVLARLNEGVRKTLASPDVIASLKKVGVETGYASSKKTGEFLRADSAKWAKRVKDAGIKPQ